MSLPNIYADVSNTFNISRDRYEFISSYVQQMIIDYQGNVADIIKEILLNLKGNEIYFTIYMMGRSSSHIFSRSNDKAKENFITSIINALKLDQDRIGTISQFIEDTILKDIDEEVPRVDIIKKIINSNFSNTEKDYILFVFGLIS